MTGCWELFKKEKKINHRFALMKMRQIAFAVLMFAGLSAHSQKGFRIGPSAGIISSRAYVVDSIKSQYNFRFKSGFSGGVAMQYGFSDRYTLASGVNYVNKGYRLFNDSNKTGDLIKHNFNNIEVPINLITRLGYRASSKMRIVTGVTLNYTMSKTNALKTNKGNTFSILESHKSTFYPMLNIGLEIGSVSATGNMFVLSAVYRQSFFNVTGLAVRNNVDLSKPELFTLGFRGSYLGVSISYLFDSKNFKRETLIFE